MSISGENKKITGAKIEVSTTDFNQRHWLKLTNVNLKLAPLTRNDISQRGILTTSHTFYLISIMI